MDFVDHLGKGHVIVSKDLCVSLVFLYILHFLIGILHFFMYEMGRDRRMTQELANFFSKEPYSKYFGLCRPYVISITHSSLFLVKNPVKLQKILFSLGVSLLTPYIISCHSSDVHAVMKVQVAKVMLASVPLCESYPLNPGAASFHCCK